MILPAACDLVRVELGVRVPSLANFGLHRWPEPPLDRWRILVVGLITATIAGIAVWLQVALLIWGRKTKRFRLMTLDWPEEIARIEASNAWSSMRRRDAGAAHPGSCGPSSPGDPPVLKPAE
jgi:hypothetical protein